MHNFSNRLLSHHQLPRSSNKCTINKTSKTIPIQTNTKLYFKTNQNIWAFPAEWQERPLPSKKPSLLWPTLTSFDGSAGGCERSELMVVQTPLSDMFSSWSHLLMNSFSERENVYSREMDEISSHLPHHLCCWKRPFFWRLETQGTGVHLVSPLSGLSPKSPPSESKNGDGQCNHLVPMQCRLPFRSPFFWRPVNCRAESCTSSSYASFPAKKPMTASLFFAKALLHPPEPPLWNQMHHLLNNMFCSSSTKQHHLCLQSTTNVINPPTPPNPPFETKCIIHRTTCFVHHPPNSIILVCNPQRTSLTPPPPRTPSLKPSASSTEQHVLFIIHQTTSSRFAIHNERH